MLLTLGQTWQLCACLPTALHDSQVFKDLGEKEKAINATVDARIDEFRKLLPDKYNESYGVEIETIVQRSLQRCKVTHLCTQT